MNTSVLEQVPNNDDVIAVTRAWLEQVVIGLNLCPFAEPVYRNQQIAYYVSQATDEAGLMDDLIEAIDTLMSTDADEIDTALLIHPRALQDFEIYNEFIGWAENFLAESGLESVVQIASFHPDYRFAGTEASDITNGTNRSPFPMLHLLREASVEAALTTLPEAAQLVEKNLDTLRNLGQEGWETLVQRIHRTAKSRQ